MYDTDVARWQRDFPAEPAAVSHVRRAVTARAVELGASEELSRDIALAVSEAATNVVVHAFVDSTPGLLRVVVEPLDGQLAICVVDDGSGLVPRSDSPGIGLGLPTIGQLTESFDIRDGPGGQGTEVRMVFEAPGVRAPAVPPVQEDWRFELLGEIARSAGAGWPGPGVERVVELLVPRVADACAVDLVEHGVQRRIAARVEGDLELSAWLAARRPPAEAMDAVLAALRSGDIRIIDVDEVVTQALASAPGDVEQMERADLRWWVNIPLMDGDTLLGSLGLGLQRERPSPHRQVAFLAALGERAARGLANTQLIDELRHTRERLEGILSALSEAVTVNDVRGKVVYANEAAAELLGAESIEEVLAAEPGELAGRFDITREDGSPVALDDLPGFRLLAGLEAPPLLTRSTHKATGRTTWLLTKATLLEGDETLAVSIIDDVTALKEAESRLRELDRPAD